MLLTLVLSGFVGVSLGLLGGGGSILMLPILRYVVGMEPHPAIALSLLVVAATSAGALIPHARRGVVRWRIGGLFGIAGMAGAYLAGGLARFVPPVALLVGFGLLMLVAAFAMLRKSSANAPDTPAPAQGSKDGRLSLPKVLAEGFVVGSVTGLVGAGGGFLVVPALTLLGGLPMPAAIGTSLLVIALKSTAGLLGFIGHTSIDWSFALAVTGAALFGSLVGSLVGRRIRARTLREAFGWFVVAVGLFVLAQELPGAFGLQPSLRIALLVSIGVTLSSLMIRTLARARARRTARHKGRPVPPVQLPSRV
jgi:uncharacterized protein